MWPTFKYLLNYYFRLGVYINTGKGVRLQIQTHISDTLGFNLQFSTNNIKTKQQQKGLYGMQHKRGGESAKNKVHHTLK
jgi:hypothetical protein